MAESGGYGRAIRRREFLKVGSLAVGGASLQGMLSSTACAQSGSLPVTGKSVVFVFMHGGPSQIETFDPKPSAPPGITSATGHIQTSVPGVRFGGTFPELARLADRFSIVRSFQTGDSLHDIKPIVGRHSFEANIGSLYARVAGPNRADNGLPTNAALYPLAVDSSTMPAFKQFGDFEATGPLGSGFAPFAPSSGGPLKQNMQLNVPVGRLDDRRLLLSRLDRLKRTLDVGGALDGLDDLRRQAFDTILGDVGQAFDLSSEDPGVVARYDTAPLLRPHEFSTRWKNRQRYADNAKSLGKLLLLARRLCERGCGFVTVTTNFVWDMHADVNNAGMEEGMGYMGRPFDRAISAFLEDVAARGLSDRILLVCTGEMGRTPRLNVRGGRDHWGGLAPLLLAGGGAPAGAVIGRSTGDAAEPMTNPITIPNLIASIMRTLVDVGELRVTPGIPDEVLRAATADPIPEVA